LNPVVKVIAFQQLILVHTDVLQHCHYKHQMLYTIHRKLSIYLARLLDVTMNNGTLPSDWKRTMGVPVHKGVIDH